VKAPSDGQRPDALRVNQEAQVLPTRGIIFSSVQRQSAKEKAALTNWVHQPCRPCQIQISICPFALPTANTSLPFFAQLDTHEKTCNQQQPCTTDAPRWAKRSDAREKNGWVPARRSEGEGGNGMKGRIHKTTAMDESRRGVLHGSPVPSPRQSGDRKLRERRDQVEVEISISASTFVAAAILAVTSVLYFLKHIKK
jgi:hypothetical protein